MIKQGLSVILCSLLMTSVSADAKQDMQEKMKALQEKRAKESENVEAEIQSKHKTQTFWNGRINFDQDNKFQKAEYDALMAHINPDDLKSYDFIEGFIERSTELTQFSDIEKGDIRLDLLNHQKDFIESRNMVLKPLKMSMRLYSTQQRVARRRRSFQLKDKIFAIWRCMNPIHQIFDSFASMMRFSQRVTKKQFEFIEISSKPLGEFTSENRNEDVVDIFHEIYQAFKKDDFHKMGYNLADLAWILRDPEHDHLYDLWGIKRVGDVEEIIKPEFFDHSKDEPKQSEQSDEVPQSAKSENLNAIQ